MTTDVGAGPSLVAARLAEQLDEQGIAYAFGGALALGVWAVPRTTVDVDVNVFVGEDRLEELFTALERAGALVDRGEARRNAARIGMLVAKIGRTRVDVFIAHHPMHVDMETRRVAVEHPEMGARYFLSASDIALVKLIYNRPKDVTDLERLFAVQGDGIDVDYVRSWLERIVPGDDPRFALLDRLSTIAAGR